MARKRAAQARTGGLVTIAVMNKAKTELGFKLPDMTKALQKCYDLHFLPVWGYPVRLYTTHKAKPSDWQLVFFDDADSAGDLGYHRLTKNGRPISKVFVKTTLDAGESISATACHELFEMVIDPLANLWAQGAEGAEYAYEMSDAVEEDTFKVDGFDMSNFLHPAWFEPLKHPRGTKFDHLGLLKKPFSMTRGGYVTVKKNGKVNEEFGSPAKARRFEKEDRLGHRSEHRKGERGKLIKVSGKHAAR